MAKIRACGILRRYAEGQLIQQRGDRTAGISFVESGRVVAGNVGADGTVLTSAVLNPGECFGEFTLFAGLPRTHDLWTAEDTEITHINGADFLALFNCEPDIARAMLTLTLRRNHELLEFMDAQRRLPVTVRIARLLLTAVDDNDSGVEVDVRQEDIAMTLGISRVSIGKALKTLQRAGLIAPGYGRILVPDAGQLASWVDERYRERHVTPVKPIMGRD